MRIVAFSDTHSCHRGVEVPNGDVLVFAGDMCSVGSLDEVKIFGEWFNKLPHRYKIYVAGNHDWEFQRNLVSCVNEIEGYYLQDDSITINEVKFWGAPWTPMFCDWAFMKDRGNAIMERWNRIPDDTDVLVTHGPPSRMLDSNDRENCGCYDLKSAVERVKPKLHLFGHIHEGYGKDDNKDTVFANVSILDEGYAFQDRPPMVFDI